MLHIDYELSYGLMLSGGIDSAILLSYMADKYPKINLQCFTIPKHDGASLYADTVIKKVNERFGTKFNSTIFVGNPDAHHRLQSTTAINDIFDRYKIDWLFNALNTNPTELDNLPGAPQRDKASTNPKMIFPFVDLTKDKILEIMFNNSYDFLMEITHSCTEMQLTRCNKCWQCKERAWAFGHINKLDKGKF